MDKPISLAMNEFKAKIEEAIEQSKLPMFIIEPIFLNYYLQIKQSSEAQTIKEIELYKSKEEGDKS